jgi:hypothetical protein
MAADLGVDPDRWARWTVTERAGTVSRKTTQAGPATRHMGPIRRAAMIVNLTATKLTSSRRRHLFASILGHC